MQISQLYSAFLRFAGRVRTRDEFPKGGVVLQAQRRDQPASGWTLERIKQARDNQLAGQFQLPVALAKAMRTDDAMFTAYLNRIAPQNSVASRLVAAPGVRGEAIQRKAATAVQVSRSTLAGIDGTMADHGVAIGYVQQETDPDGTLVSMRLTEWPLEHVRYNPSLEILETNVRDGGARVPIVHGDGTWIKFQKFDVMPWTQDACVLPGAMVWAGHAYALSDWAAASRSHGQAKIIGKMPQGFSLQSADGVAGLTPEANGFLRMLQDIVSGEAGAGIAPFGSETTFLANGSNAWQVFSEFIMDRNKGAMRIYTGTDASLGSVGGAPGVDIATLFGVATTRLQGDFDAIEQGLNTGLYQPWAAINFGDSRLAPKFEYQLPDPDADKRSADRAAARDRLNKTIADMKASGLVVDQATVNQIALEYGVSPAPVGGPPNPKAFSALGGDYDESKHPRADDGKFGTGPGSGNGSADEEPADDNEGAFEPSYDDKKFKEKSADAAAFLKNHKGLESIKAYSGNEEYRSINDAMRGVRSADPDKQRASLTRANEIQSALQDAKAAGHAYDGVVYRGLEMSHGDLDRLKESKTVDFQGFASTSANRLVAEGFSDESKGGPRVLMRIRQRSGVPIAGVADMPSEKEVLLPHGIRLKLVGHSRDEDGRHALDFEEVDQ